MLGRQLTLAEDFLLMADGLQTACIEGSATKKQATIVSTRLTPPERVFGYSSLL